MRKGTLLFKGFVMGVMACAGLYGAVAMGLGQVVLGWAICAMALLAIFSLLRSEDVI